METMIIESQSQLARYAFWLNHGYSRTAAFTLSQYANINPKNRLKMDGKIS